MVELELDLKKTVEQNAAEYFERAKKLKRKAEGARKAVEKMQLRLAELLEKQKVEEEKEAKKAAVVKKELKWYEKFHWFYSSDGHLVVCGRDATSNEIVVKKHTDPADIVFHTETPGSPFCVVKSGGKPVGESTISETAQFCASYSRMWKLGVGVADVFWVNPDQVTKEAKAGEFIAKGAFMVYGKKNFIRGVNLKLAIGVMKDGSVMSGPLNAVKKHCEKYLNIDQGGDKPSDVAKKIAKKLKIDDLDAIIRVLPGPCRVRE